MSATSKLQQINARYINTEDRILLRTSTSNNEEYLLWLTRRYTGLLLDVLAKEIDARGGTTSLGSQSETRAMYDKGAFNKPYTQSEASSRPLGDHGLLAYAIKSATDPEGNLVLEIQAQDGKGISYRLNDALLYMLYSLLAQTVEVADWRLKDATGAPTDNHMH